MTTQNIGLMKALIAKMDYLDQRQRVISQNIANADTPQYRPQDLKPVDFSNVLKATDGEMHVSLETTQEGHMPPPGSVPPSEGGKQKPVYEVAPAGNAVILEEQMISSNRTAMDYNLMTNLYQKQVGMIHTALDRGS